MGCGASSESKAEEDKKNQNDQQQKEQDKPAAAHNDDKAKPDDADDDAAAAAPPPPGENDAGDVTIAFPGKVFIEVADMTALLEKDAQGVRLLDVRHPPSDEPKRPAAGTGRCPRVKVPVHLAGSSGPKTGKFPCPDVNDFIRHCRTHFGVGLCAPAEEKPIVLFDVTGGAMAASRLWWLLDTIGVKNVYVLNGGLQAYVAADLPMTEEPLPGPFSEDGAVAWPYKTEWWRVHDVEQVKDQPLLCDCRPPPGCLSTIRPCLPFTQLAGRIPQSSLLPGPRNLIEMNRLKPIDKLREIFEKNLASTSSTDFSNHTFSCNMGHWNCFNAAVATHLGLGTPAVFFGSFTCYEAHYPDDVIARTKQLHGIAALKVLKVNQKAWQIVGEELPVDDGAPRPFSYALSVPAVEDADEGKALVRKLLRVMEVDEEIEAETAGGERFTVTTFPTPPPPGEEEEETKADDA